MYGSRSSNSKHHHTITMSSSGGTKRLLRTIRLSSMIIYVIDLGVCLNWAVRFSIYERVIIAAMCCFNIVVHFTIMLGRPVSIYNALDRPDNEFLFTYRARFLMDVQLALFLYCMDLGGIMMAVITLGQILGIRFITIQHPPLLLELFRTGLVLEENTTYSSGGRGGSGSFDEETYDQTYEATLESTR